MKSKKGFTLIELLAVIVILGLLMAIAIPSVTKYITQSRKKTVTTTIGNYINALVNQVNDMEYVFTDIDTVYAVPIECIALERGGTNPFGYWLHANNSYWAYVLVQYDDNTSSYTYGFTFKDSAGYGLYPTSSEKINENGNQVLQDLSLTKPIDGKVTNITSLKNWLGFNVNEDTNLIVLEALSEGETGNGKTTCTLCQKGENYDDAINNVARATLKSTSKTDTTAFRSDSYKQKIKNIIFESGINVPESAVKSWDISAEGNNSVMAFIITNSSNSSYYDLYIQSDGELYAAEDMSYWFYEFKYVDSVKNIELLNTHNVKNMNSMFSRLGYSSSIFKLDLGSNFDTSNVTKMNSMFYQIGHDDPVFTLDLGDKFDTSNVTDMKDMLRGIGFNSKELTLELGDKFDTSNVTTMNSMFSSVGYSNPNFVLDLGDKFDTSNVTDMRQMFYRVGYSNKEFHMSLGNKFNTEKVANMRDMFYYLGYKSTNLTLDLGNKFDTSNVTDMGQMFYYAGYNSPTFKMDCSKWNVDKVTYHSNFNTGVTSKVKAPVWK